MTVTDDEPDAARPQPRRPGLKLALFWSYALTGGMLATTTVVMFVLTALLGPRVFGVMALALLVLIVAQNLLHQVLVTALIQREELDDAHLQAGFWLVLLGSLILAGLTIAGSRLWAAYNSLPELAEVCVALSPVIVLHGLVVVPDVLLRRRLAFRTLAGCHLAAAVAGGVGGIWLALAGAGVWALVAQQMITALLSAVLLWSVTRWRPRDASAGRRRIQL